MSHSEHHRTIHPQYTYSTSMTLQDLTVGQNPQHIGHTRTTSAETAASLLRPHKEKTERREF